MSSFKVARTVVNPLVPELNDQCDMQEIRIEVGVA